MKQFIVYILLQIPIISFSQTIQGTVTENGGSTLAYASILVKGTAWGTTANKDGVYTLNLKNGNYTIICQHIGHKPQEKKVTINNNATLTINFELEKQEYKLNDVVVKSGGEDPAYAIIRNAIKKRPDYLDEIKKFECDVYLKGQLQLRDYPKKFFGEKVDFEDGDTSKRKMIFLSETIAKYAVEKPNNAKVEVISTRVSGNSDGFGFANPQIISFYENIISIGRGLNPRGFVSPIANNALNFYKYKYEGTYYENGLEINRIKVIPKRKYEPLFSGYISIIENQWRIYSTELYLLKEQQMQFIDTLVIEQLYVPLKNVWVTKQQVIYPAGKILGFDFFGSFVQVYDNYNINPSFKKNFFNNVLIKVYDSANKKEKAYWDSVRPVPLLAVEEKDYKKKDSLEQVRKNPKYLDSVDKKNNKITLTNLILTGKTLSNSKKKEYWRIDPLFNNINYNTVEGWVINTSPSFTKNYEGRKSVTITANLRYGFNNKHFNGYGTFNYNFGKKHFQNLNFSSGKRVLQFNNNAPIDERNNTTATLLYTRNYMKIYEAWFGKLQYSTGIGKGISIYGAYEYQDRLSLHNLENIKVWNKVEGREFTPNYPTALMAAPMPGNKASILTAGIVFRPGTKYVELPNRTVSLGSKYPTLRVELVYSLKNFMQSNVDYSRWSASVNDNLNLKLGGRLSYRVKVGGFIHNNQAFVPDYQHILGNQTALASPYLQSFQLAPYYQYSNTATFYTTSFIEYHLNGLITNKIPLLKKWNWFFVVGGNALTINNGTQYYEALFGIENIFKVIRVDFVAGFSKTGYQSGGIRINLPGFLTGN